IGYLYNNPVEGGQDGLSIGPSEKEDVEAIHIPFTHPYSNTLKKSKWSKYIKHGIKLKIVRDKKKGFFSDEERYQLFDFFPEYVRVHAFQNGEKLGFKEEYGKEEAKIGNASKDTARALK